MTTKYKIIIGFVSILVILVVVALQGYLALDASQDGLQEYRRFARINAELGGAVSSLNAARASLNRFDSTGDIAFAKEILTHLDQLDKLLDAALKDIRVPSRRENVQRNRQAGRDYKELVIKFTEAFNKMHETYRTKVVSNRVIADETLALMAKTAHGAQNNDMQYAIHQGAMTFAAMRYGTAAYISMRSDEEAKALEASMKNMDQHLALMDTLVLPAGRPTFIKLQTAFKNWDDAIEDMIAQGRLANSEFEAMLQRSRTILKELPEVSVQFDTLMRETGGIIAAQTADSQKMLLGGSAGGAGLGIIAALVIILGLIKVLRETSVFAHALADGDFQAQVKNREKGEIGVMLESMRQIPAVLQAILNEFQTLEKRAEEGELEAKGNAGA
jgi:hypothetical protein